MPEETGRPKRVKGVPSKYKLLWEAFRGEYHKIDFEIADRRWAMRGKVLLSQAKDLIVKSHNQLSEEERKEIRNNVEQVLATMVKPKGKAKVGEKLILKSLAEAIEQLTLKVERPEQALEKLFDNAIENLELRKQSTEKIIQGVFKEVTAFKKYGNK